MKLDIEAMAREADPDFGNPDGLLSESLCGMEAIEAFARRIVERCAQEADKLAAVYGCLEGHKAADCRTDAKYGIKDAAAAIRNLLED